MTSLLACLTCAKTFEHAGGNAAGYAILVMLILLVLVLGIVAYCFIRLGLKSRQAMDPEYADTFNLPQQ